MLDSLAHAVKTPLTAIQTASAGVREVGSLNESQSKLVALIEDESRDLSLLCTKLLVTAKLEVEEFLGKEEIAVSGLITRVYIPRRQMVGHPVEVDVSGSALKIRGDSELLSMVLTQFLDNATKYSFDGREIKVAAWESHSEVMISVHNFGPTIPMSDREKIFQRFFAAKDPKIWQREPELGYRRSRWPLGAQRPCLGDK